MDRDDSRHAFAAALDALVEEIKQDRSVLAASCAAACRTTRVWAKSDIDLVLVTIDDKQGGARRLDVALRGRRERARVPDAARASSARLVEGAMHNSFMHSLLAKGRLLYTHDETIADLCDGLHAIGERDTQFSSCAPRRTRCRAIYKARKWFVTRGDLDYTRCGSSTRRRRWRRSR